MEGASFPIIKMGICEDDGKIRIRKTSIVESSRALAIPTRDPNCLKCSPEDETAPIWFGKKYHTAVCKRIKTGMKAYLADIHAVQRDINTAYNVSARWDELIDIGRRIEGKAYHRCAVGVNLRTIEKVYRSIQETSVLKVMFIVIGSLRRFQAILVDDGGRKVAQGSICFTHADAARALLDALENTLQDMAPPPYSP
jgi:hypothetical protein